MNLLFHCSGHCDDGDCANGSLDHDAVAAQFHSHCDRRDWPLAAPQFDTNPGHPLAVRFELPLTESGSDDESLIVMMQLIQLLCDLSDQFNLNWQVGHQLEPQLGSIRNGCPQSTLITELQTSIIVGRSLAAVIVDDEWVDGEFASDQPADPTASASFSDDQAWHDLLQPPEAFARFPEWEEE
ncbi:hypothetical protein NHH03_20120 [Stieleria sp. TO1_6]|uniref:hypothetical protein n=1 Tax=Stieleria tagensis TaxID=2956795 RepID=UPI00209A7919|nr:hypothetical protein [Stieleria tagensis]MCO8124061.1 hypothetical protein [Stieleria tagensis]